MRHHPSVSHSVVSDSLPPQDCSSPGSSSCGDSPGKNTGVGCHSLLQGIFLTQECNLGLLHCRQILYRLSHQRSPKGPGKFIQWGEARRKPMSRIMPRMAFWAGLGNPAPGISESIYPCPCRREGMEQRPHHSILGKECLRQKSL